MNRGSRGRRLLLALLVLAGVRTARPQDGRGNGKAAEVAATSTALALHERRVRDALERGGARRLAIERARAAPGDSLERLALDRALLEDVAGRAPIGRSPLPAFASDELVAVATPAETVRGLVDEMMALDATP